MIKKNPPAKYLAVLIIAISFNGFSQVLAWYPQNSQTLANLRNINFADNATGWFFGDSLNGVNFKKGIVKKTSNQGVTWASQSIGSDSIQILSSHVFNTSTLIAVGKFQTTGKGAVIKTTNGGLTWSRDTSTVPQRLTDVDFVSNSLGWIVGRNGYLGITTNGGATWTAQTTGFVPNLSGIDFFDANNGWAVGAATGSVSIIHTNNGGATYTNEINPLASDLFAVYAFSASKAIAVGPGGKMIMTTNSGNLWTVVASGTTNDLLDITFVDPLNGWAVGAGGTIVVSTDGGLTWATQVSGITKDIKSISMKTTTLGWYCGLSGNVRFFGNSPASIKDFSNTNYSANIFPNPANSTTTIQIPAEFSLRGAEMKLYDISGKELLKQNITENQTDINRKSLSEGVYFIRLVNNGGQSISGKLIFE